MSRLSPRLPVASQRTAPQRAAGTVPVIDVLIPGGLAVAALLDTAGSGSLVHPWTEVWAVLTTAPIALRTRAPLVMALTVAVGLVGYAAMPATGTPMWCFLGVLVIGFSVGAHLDGRRRWVGLAVLVASTYAVQLIDAARGIDELTWGEVYLTPPVIILAPAFAGWLLQRSRRQTADVRRLAAELAAERDRHAETAALAERSRIARELHDVISHSVSVMVVQAGAAENMIAPDDPARAAVRAVRDTGREALAELRRSARPAARDGADRSAAPMPALRDLPRLAEARSAADLETVGDVAGIDLPGLELAAYRVVQEALTNARRHANGGPVRVRRHETRGRAGGDGARRGRRPAPPRPWTAPAHGLRRDAGTGGALRRLARGRAAARPARLAGPRRGSRWEPGR